MSLATRCPACGTTFRIEPAQLALADGWARCGRCSRVFDAAAERHERADDASTSFPAQAASAPNDADAFGAALMSFRAEGPPSTPRSGIDDALQESDVPDAPDDGAATRDASLPSSTTPEPLSPSVPPAPSAFDPWRELPSLSLEPNPAASAPPTDRPVPPIAASIETADDVAAEPSASSVPVASVAPVEQAEQAGALWPVPPSGSSEPPPGPSGVRKAARAESVAPAGVIQAASEPVNDEDAGARKPSGAGRRRFRRVAILVVVIVLLLVLLAQMLYRQRDAVAARHPALRPVLAGLCGFAGCAIEPLRRPGAIAIEGATFTHAQSDDRYRLAFALRNQADVPLAVPAIELSLLDAQERVVVRRVLTPAEFGAAEATLPALAEHAGTVSFALDDGRDGRGDEPLPRIAGYAMVAFYP